MRACSTASAGDAEENKQPGGQGMVLPGIGRVAPERKRSADRNGALLFLTDCLYEKKAFGFPQSSQDWGCGSRKACLNLGNTA